jgi:hypothetical protein
MTRFLEIRETRESRALRRSPFDRLVGLVNLASLVGTLVVAGPARAAPPQESQQSSADEAQRVKDLMRTGINAYRNGHLEAARVAFAEAWRLRQHVAIASSLAEVEMKLGRYQEAAEHWEYVLKNAEDDRGSNRSDAEEQLDECHRHLGRAKIMVAGGPAEVFLDGQSLGLFALRDELWLAPGPHHFHVVADGREGPAQTVTIKLGDVQVVRLERTVAPAIAPAPSPSSTSVALVPPATESRPPEQDDSRQSSGARTIVLISGAALTAAAAAAGLAFTLQANGKEDDVELLQRELAASGDPNLTGSSSQCRPPSGEPPKGCTDLRDALDAMDTARHRATGSFIAAGAFGVATIATYLLWPDESGPEKERGARLVVAPWAYETGRGVQLEMNF